MKINTHRVLYVLLILIVLLLYGCGGGGSSTVLPPTPYSEAYCVVGATIKGATGNAAIPACSGEEMTGGGFGFSNSAGKAAWNMCKVLLEPWKGAEAGTIPYNDLLAVMKYKTTDAGPCPGGYEEIAKFSYSLKKGVKGATKICGKPGQFPTLATPTGEAETGPTGNVIAPSLFSLPLPEVPQDPCTPYAYCYNRQQDCDESGVDCGGPNCEACTAPESNFITGNAPLDPNNPCDSHCTNGQKDCGEEGKDCGRPDCRLCTGDQCADDSHCANNRLDCDETAVDSGGDDCPDDVNIQNGQATTASDLPLVEDFQYLVRTTAGPPPTCPEGYIEKGKLSAGKTGHTFCVKYSLKCACQQPDQCQAMCEYTEGGETTGATPSPSPSPAAPSGEGEATGSGGFAVDGGPGVWVKTTTELTSPLDGSPLPAFPETVIIDGTADPFFERFIQPDGTPHPLATADKILEQKGNCCLDGDECQDICARVVPYAQYLPNSQPFQTGIKLFENPKIDCALGPGIEGEGFCYEMLNGPCCGDDDKGQKWHLFSGGDCSGGQDDDAGENYMCVSDAQEGGHKWFSATEGKGPGPDIEAWRPVCGGAEHEVNSKGEWGWVSGRLGPGIHRAMDHRKSDCYWKYENNPGHDASINGFWGGAKKKPAAECPGPHHRAIYCGTTSNNEADGGINYRVDEIARLGISGITYCVSDNTFGKDLDAYPNDCGAFPIIRARDGASFPFEEEQLDDQHLTYTGSHCCGEVDDDEPYTPYDGEYYNDFGGVGSCFSSIYQPNGQYLKHTLHLARDVTIDLNEQGDTQALGLAYLTGAVQTDGGLVAETDPIEEKGVYVFNGTHIGCNLAGAYNLANDLFVDLKDKPDPSNGGRDNIFGGGFIDPTEGDTPLISDQTYCSKTGPPEDISLMYCSYTEQWLERNGSERDILRKIQWDPKEAVVTERLQPGGGPTNPAQASAPYLLTDNATNTSLLFVDQECCGVTQCWTGYQCIDDQSDNPSEAPHPETVLQNGQAFRCIKGVWNSALLKHTPDGSEAGYCPQDPQCLYDLEGNESQNGCTDPECAPQCVNDGQYVKDDYCDKGDWTTRTRLLAQIMLDKTRVETDALDYTLFCGPAGISLNNPQNPGDANNYCTLTFEDHVILGTTYNGNRTGVIDALRQSLIFSYDNLDKEGPVKEFGSDCSVSDNFNECASLQDRNGKDLVHLYHNGGLKMIVVSAENAPGFDGSNPFTILWNWLKDVFGTIVQSSAEPFELTDFNQLYLSSLTPQRIYGVTETLFNQNRSVNDTKIFDQIYTLQYVGYNTDFNGLLGGVMAEKKEIIGAAGEQTVIFVNPAQDVWPQFTEKLRPKRAEATE